MADIAKRTRGDGKVSYRVRVRLKGQPMQSATFERLTDAKKWATQTEADIRAGRYFKDSEAKKHTLTEAIDRYLRDILPGKKAATRYSQNIQLQWWKTHLGDFLLSNITPPVLAETRDILASEITYRHTVRSSSSVNRYISVLSHVFTIAVREWQWLEDSPMRRVSKLKEPRGRVRFLSDDERARLLAACKESRNKDLYDFVVLLLCTGARKNEIRCLQWQNVDLQQSVIRLLETKNDERRVIPVTGPALDILRERSRYVRMDNLHVFPAPFRHGEKPRPVDFQSAWDWAVARAELEDFRLHDLRHSAASYLAMNGATLAEIAEVLGHKTLQMVKRYAHLTEVHTGKILGRMTAAIFKNADAEGMPSNA